MIESGLKTGNCKNKFRNGNIFTGNKEKIPIWEYILKTDI